MEQHIFASQLVAVEPYLISHALVLEHGNRMDAEDLTQDAPQRGINVRVQKLSNGRIVTNKVMIK